MASERTYSFDPSSEVIRNQDRDVYDDGYLRIEYDNYYVVCGGRRVLLPLKEFLIFSRLARNVERTVTAQEIWRSAWKAEIPFNSLSLRVHIHRLRKTFHPLGLHIGSMVGVGYCLSVTRDEQAQTRK
jgi:DNA-binding response OmpR family regulator